MHASLVNVRVHLRSLLSMTHSVINQRASIPAARALHRGVRSIVAVMLLAARHADALLQQLLPSRRLAIVAKKTDDFVVGGEN